MAIFTIPSSRNEIRQNGRSDYGEFVESFGIDLNQKFGKIFTSKKLVKVLDEDTDLGGNFPIAIEKYKDRFYLLTDDDLYRVLSGDPTVTANWSEVTEITSTTNSDSDLVVFDGKLLISRGGDIFSWDGTTFANNWDSGRLTSLSNVTQMHVHRGGQETLFLLDENTVKYYNSSAGQSTVTLQADLTANCVTSGVNAIWVGTVSDSGASAYVYEIYVGEQIDAAPVARNAYKVEGTAVMAIEVIDNVPYIVTEKGNIQAFNGVGFSTVASFPFANTTEVLNLDAVHPNGMKLHNDSLYINLRTDLRDSDEDYAVNTPSGIWEFNRITGQLTHRFGFVNDANDKGILHMNDVFSGALYIMDNQYGLLLAAGESGKSTATSGLYADTGSSYGYFITGEINSGTVEDAYESVYTKAKTLADGESIEIKYRTEKFDREFADMAAARTNVINTTDTLTNVAVGWEVTDIHTGKTAHITAIDTTSGTTSLTLDRDIATKGAIFRAVFHNWTLVADTYTRADGEVKRNGGFGTNPWIQFKVILDGDIEMREFRVKSNSKAEV